MSEHRLSRARKREIRCAVKQVLDQVADRAVPAHTMEDILAFISDFLSVEIELNTEVLPEGRLACTTQIGNRIYIQVSPSCVTVRHTIAHEIGHIILGHKHLDEVNGFSVPEPPPPGFDRLYLSFLPDGPEDKTGEDLEELLNRELEAEYFADEFIQQVEFVNNAPAARLWSYALWI